MKSAACVVTRPWVASKPRIIESEARVTSLRITPPLPLALSAPRQRADA